MKQWHKSARYREALNTLLIPIFRSTEQAMEWGSHLNAKQHTTLTQRQCALSNAARSECDPERKLNLAVPIGLKSDMQQFGGAVKRSSDYVTRRFNVSTARLKNLWGWTYAEKPLNAISQFNWSPESAEMRRTPLRTHQNGSWLLGNWTAVNLAAK